MVFSSFAGLIVLGIPGVGQAQLLSVLSNGDRIIGSDYDQSAWNIDNRVELMNGNLTVRAGGVVTVTNGGLSFAQDTGPDGMAGTADDHVYTLIVEDGGRLVLQGSVLTTLLDTIHNYPSLGVMVRSGGVLEANDSLMQFPGHIIVDDSTLIMRNSTITGHDAADISTFCDPEQFPSDVFDDSAVLMIVSSDAFLYDSTIEGLFENSTLPLFTTASHSYGFVADDVGRAVVTYDLTRVVSALGALNNAPGESLESLLMDDQQWFTVGIGETLATDGIDVAGLAFSENDGVVVTLNVKYRTDAGYAGVAPINWGFRDGALSSSGIVPSDTSTVLGNEDVIESAVLPAMSSADLSGLNINFANAVASNVYFNKLWVSVEIQVPTYRNVTLAGSTQFTAVNSYIGADFTNKLLMHNQLAVRDNANAYLYGVHVDMTQTASPSSARLPAYTTVAASFDAGPSSIGAGDTTVGESIADLANNDNIYYDVGLMESIEIDGFNVSGLTGELSGAILNVRYITGAGYAGTNYVRYAVDGGALANTTVQPVDTAVELVSSFDLYAVGVSTLDEIADLTVSFSNIAVGNTVYFEQVWIEVTLRPNIYIYRWLDFNAVDSLGQPAEGTWVNATLSVTGVPAYYCTPSGVSDTPPIEVLDYLEKDAARYKRTDALGDATIPLLWEVMNDTSMPNSWVVGGYDISATYVSAGGSMYNVLGGVSFAPYPALSEEDQVQELSLVFSDLVIGNELDMIVENDDTVTISGGTFPWRANIIIKDNGTLVVDEVNLVIAQLSANQFRILVQDAGTLILNGAMLTSGYSLSVQLSDAASLVVNNSVIDPLVTIMADGASTIEIGSSTVHSDVIAPATSSAVLTAENTTFTKAWSSFGGNAVAYLASVAIPSLSPTGNAVIHHYRWITVTVLDGTGAPLPDAVVTLSYYLNGTGFGTAIAGADGRVTLRGYCDRITSTAREFYGNYRANATFWYDGTPYSTDGYTTVSLDPYTAPLVRHDVSKTMTIPEAQPELDPPLWISDTTPARGQEIVLMSNVTNTGVVPAINVLVRFYDNGAPIADVVLEEIGPGEVATAETTWVVSYPIGTHNVLVMVDPENTIPEWDETNNANFTLLDVRAVASLSVSASDVTVVPSSPTKNSTATIQVVVHNLGDLDAEVVNVTFYDTPFGGSQAFVAYSLISRILANGTGVATVSWIPDVPGMHTITVIVDEAGLIEELSEADNQADAEVVVKDYADLVPLSIVFTPASPVNANAHVTMDANIENVGESTASNVLVRFWLGSAGTGTVIDETTVPSIAAGQILTVSGEWDASVTPGLKVETRMITVEVNPDAVVPEISYDNNIGFQSIVVVDRRPDLKFVGGVEVTSGGHVIEEASIGESVVIGVNVTNDGYSSAMGVAIQFLATDSDGLTTFLGNVMRDIAGNESVIVNFTWSVNVTVGQYFLNVVINPTEAVEEGSFNNNDIFTVFQVNAPNPNIAISLGPGTSFKSGTDITVSGLVTNMLTGDPLVDVPVKVSLLNSASQVIGVNSSTMTGSTGAYQTSKYIPPGEVGNYRVLVTVTIGDQTFSQYRDITITKGFVEAPTDWWIYAVIIAIVAAIIIFFSVYLYRYGLGKMVECGECGALIPEASKRCPKCGVEFETGTAKCSECGAWIPANSTECPECGAKFVAAPIPEEEDEYIRKMREQYQAFVDGHREQAKEVLGKKYSETKFADWWKKQPSYVTFEKWLSQEEERRKLGAFACPVCGTLNPRGAKVCHKCGTVFETPKEAAPAEGAEEEGKPRLRRIVKRPIEKKTAKKEEPAEGKPPEQPGTPPSEGDQE